MSCRVISSATSFQCVATMVNLLRPFFAVQSWLTISYCIGLALAPWDVLASGKLRSDAEEQKRKDSGEGGRMRFGGTDWERNEEEKKMSAALEKVAKEVGTEHLTAGLSSDCALPIL